MPAGDLVQIGTTVVVGLNGVTYGTLLPKSGTEKPIANLKSIFDGRMAEVTNLVTNPGRQYTVEGVMLAADLTALRALTRYGTISINGTNCRLDDLELGFSGEDAFARITATKPDSLTVA